MKLVPALCALISLSGCTNATKVVVGSRSAPVPASTVEILSQVPARAYRQVGLVSVAGAQLALDGQVVRKLQKAAADLGADAVIILSEHEMTLGRGRVMRGEAIRFTPAT